MHRRRRFCYWSLSQCLGLSQGLGLGLGLGLNLSIWLSQYTIGSIVAGKFDTVIPIIVQPSRTTARFPILPVGHLASCRRHRALGDDAAILFAALVFRHNFWRDGPAMHDVVALIIADGLMDEPDAGGEAREVVGPILHRKVPAVDAPDADPSRDDGRSHPALGAAVGLVLLGGGKVFQLPTNEACGGGQVQRVGGFRQQPHVHCIFGASRASARVCSGEGDGIVAAAACTCAPSGEHGME